MSYLKAEQNTGVISEFRNFSGMEMMIIALAAYTPLQSHLPQSLGVPGLNVANLFFLTSVILLTSRGYEKLDSPPLKGNLVWFYIMLVFGFFVAQIRMPIDTLVDVTYVKTAIVYSLYFFLFYHAVRDLNVIRYLFWTMVFVTFLVGVEAFREGLAFGFNSFQPTQRAGGPFGNYSASNRAGIFFAMYTPMLLASFLYYPKTIVKLMLAVAMLFVLGGLFATYSRQAYLITAVVLTYCMVSKNKGLLVLVVILGLGYQFWAPEGVVDRMSETRVVVDGVEQLDSSTESRPILWKGGWDMFKSNPLGVGIVRFREEIGSYSSISNLDAHNFYVLTLAELGLIGFIVLMILIKNMLVLVFRLKKKMQIAAARHKDNDPYLVIMPLALTASTLSLVVGNMYGSPFLMGEVTCFFWILLAITIRYYQIRFGVAGIDDLPKEPKKAI